MRAFLGIFLPKEIQSDFRSYKQQLRKQNQNLDFVPAPDVHLTLKFLGPDVQEFTIDEIQNILPNITKNYKPFEIELGDISLGFPHDRFPKVLNLGIKNNLQLENLISDIEKSLGGGRFRDIYPPKRDSILHFTLAKLHGNLHKKKIIEVKSAIEKATWEGKGKKILVSSFHLINSEKRKSDVLYRNIGEYKLTKKDL